MSSISRRVDDSAIIIILLSLLFRNKEEASEEKKKTLPKELRCVVKYDFRIKTLALCFSDDEWEWSPVSISGMYKSAEKNIVIVEDKFEEIVNDFVFNFDKQTHTRIYKASIADIDRNVAAKRFSVKIAYMFLADPNMQHFATEYSFDVRFCTLVDI